MKITLTEALRVKNEISRIITDNQYKVRTSQFGSTYENGIEISTPQGLNFPDVIEVLEKALSLSQIINNQISAFNKETGVDQLVRELQNDKLFLGIYASNLEKFKETNTTRFQALANSREEIKVKYVPYVSLTSVKTKMSELKAKIRTNQAKIEEFNTTIIDVPFEYSDFESLV